MPWRAGIDAVRRRTRRQVPALLRRHRIPPSHRLLVRCASSVAPGSGVPPSTAGAWPTRPPAGRPLPSLPSGDGGARAHLHQARADPLRRRGAVPRRARHRDEEVPGPGQARAVGQGGGHPPPGAGPFDPTRCSPGSTGTAPPRRRSPRCTGPASSTGEDVVVKVQRSTVAELVGRDLKVLGWLAPLLVGRIPVSALANPPALVEVFAETIVEELDFRLEAREPARRGEGAPAARSGRTGSSPGPTRSSSVPACSSWSASAGSASTTSPA